MALNKSYFPRFDQCLSLLVLKVCCLFLVYFYITCTSYSLVLSGFLQYENMLIIIIIIIINFIYIAPFIAFHAAQSALQEKKKE